MITEAQFDDDYVDLVNTVQRHTQCSTAYCPTKKNSNGTLKCHFKTTLEFEPVSSKDNSTKYRA